MVGDSFGSLVRDWSENIRGCFFYMMYKTFSHPYHIHKKYVYIKKKKKLLEIKNNKKKEINNEKI